jgi:ubiquinone/menaquinone biosynthesis C-methylase UbiE
MSEIDELKQRTREQWARGNYPALAELLEPAARALVDACAISAGQEVLDVAAGTGNLAVLAAREGAAVVASDLSPHMVELGRERTAAEGLDVEWVEADAEELPFEDSRFDCAASVFGAMFAPRPERAAAELFRVVRPGGTVGLATWPAGGLAAAIFELGSKYAPGPEDIPPAILWGDEGVIRERLEGHAARVDVSSGALDMSFPSVDAALDFYERNAPNMATARAGLAPEVYARLREDFREVLAQSLTDRGTVEPDNRYVLIVARKRG